jgi:hypothetical protein
VCRPSIALRARTPDKDTLLGRAALLHSHASGQHERHLRYSAPARYSHAAAAAARMRDLLKKLLLPPPPPALGRAACAVDGGLAGLGLRLAAYATALAYLCLVRRLHKNESHFAIIRRIGHTGDCATLLTAIMVLTLLARGLRGGVAAAEFIPFAHTCGINGAVIAHARLITWMTEPSHVLRNRYDLLKRLYVYAKEVALTALYLAVYVLMWCARCSTMLARACCTAGRTLRRPASCQLF